MIIASIVWAHLHIISTLCFSARQVCWGLISEHATRSRKTFASEMLH